MSYRIAAPDEYLAITGMGIKTITITKAAWVWPMQRCVRFGMQPRDYATEIQAMTTEKLQFYLPVVFTIGPDVSSRDSSASPHEGVLDNSRDDRGDALLKYARLLAGCNEESGAPPQHVQDIVKGIIEGEGRQLVSGMTMEEILTNHQAFKRRLYDVVQEELRQFGLRIVDAHVASHRSYLDHLGLRLQKDLCGRTGDTMLANLSRSWIFDEKQSRAEHYKSTGPKMTTPMADPNPVRKPELAAIDRTQTLALQKAHAKPSSYSLHDYPLPGELYEAHKAELTNCFRNSYFLPGALDTTGPYVSLNRASQIDKTSSYRSDDTAFEDLQKRAVSLSFRSTWPLADDRLYDHRSDNRLASLTNNWMAGSTYASGYSFSPSLSKLIIGSCIIWGLGAPIVQAERVPDWLLHTVGGMTVAASACLPALQAVEDKTDVKTYWTGLCIAWAISFAVFIGMELYQRRDQTRLLLGLVAFCGVNLLGSLAGNSSSTFETIKGWGPLALSLSLWVVPEWIKLMGASRVVEDVVGGV